MKYCLAILAFSLLASACTGRTRKLEDNWAPLVEVQETTDKLINPGITTTIGTVCYTGDLKQWLVSYPPGSAQYDGILLHERAHSVRQGSLAGPGELWIARYLFDSDFRWQEEKAGWGLEITYLCQQGQGVDIERMATALNKNYNLASGGRMVSLEDARRWVQSMVDGAGTAPKLDPLHPPN